MFVHSEISLLIAVGWIAFVMCSTVNPTKQPSPSPVALPPYRYLTSAPTSPTTWKEHYIPFQVDLNGYGKEIATSYSGQYMALTSDLGIYGSSDYGSTFLWTNAPIATWSSVVSDSTGLKMFAIKDGTSIWSSKGDFWKGWSAVGLSVDISTLGTQYTNIAIDSNAKYLYALTKSCTLYRFLVTTGVSDTTTSITTLALNTTCGRLLVDSTGVNVIVQGDYATEIAVSNDYGKTFVMRDLLMPLDSKYVTLMSSYGTQNSRIYIPAGSTAPTMQVSVNNGALFTTQALKNCTSSLICSGTGQVIMYGVGSSTMWLSEDYGATYYKLSGLDGFDAAAMNFNGTSVYALLGHHIYIYHAGNGLNGKVCIDGLSSFRFSLDGSVAMPPTFQPTPYPTAAFQSIPIALTSTPTIQSYITSIAMSEDGTYVTMGTTNNGIFSRQSMNGAFMNPALLAANGSISHSVYILSVSMSLYGQYQVATTTEDSTLYLSDDFGVTWKNATDNGLGKYGNYHNTMSDDGSVIFLSVDYDIFVIAYNSLTNGKWNPKFIRMSYPSSIGRIRSIGMDNSGSTLVILHSFGFVSVSHNYGYTWQQKSDIPNFPIVEGAAIGRTNGFIIAYAYEVNQIATSFDYGTTWIIGQGPGSPESDWAMMSSSSTGQYIVGALYATDPYPQGLYQSSDYGQSWTYLYPLYDDVAISPLGNYLIVPSYLTNQIYIYQQLSVPTAAPTLHAPSLQPTPTSAPYKPLSDSYHGWVTRYQYADGIYSGNAVMVTGFRTNTCITTVSASSNVLAVKYTCDANTIVMTQYSDIACTQRLPTTKSYVNGERFYDDDVAYMTTMQCTEGTSVASSLPYGDYYGTLQYFNPGNCTYATYYHAMKLYSCVMTSDTSSVMMDYPIIYEYTSSSICTGSYETIDLSDNVCSYSTSSTAAHLIDSSFVQNAHIRSTSKSMEKTSSSLRAVMDKERRVLTSSSEGVEFAYFYGDDDYWLDGSQSLATLEINSTWWTELIKLLKKFLSTGLIVGIVVASICGCGLLVAGGALIFFMCCRKSSVNAAPAPTTVFPVGGNGGPAEIAMVDMRGRSNNGSVAPSPQKSSDPRAPQKTV